MVMDLIKITIASTAMPRIQRTIRTCQISSAEPPEAFAVEETAEVACGVTCRMLRSSAFTLEEVAAVVCPIAPDAETNEIFFFGRKLKRDRIDAGDFGHRSL